MAKDKNKTTNKKSKKIATEVIPSNNTKVVLKELKKLQRKITALEKEIKKQNGPPKSSEKQKKQNSPPKSSEKQKLTINQLREHKIAQNTRELVLKYKKSLNNISERLNGFFIFRIFANKEIKVFCQKENLGTPDIAVINSYVKGLWDDFNNNQKNEFNALKRTKRHQESIFCVNIIASEIVTSKSNNSEIIIISDDEKDEKDDEKNTGSSRISIDKLIN